MLKQAGGKKNRQGFQNFFPAGLFFLSPSFFSSGSVGFGAGGDKSGKYRAIPILGPGTSRFYDVCQAGQSGFLSLIGRFWRNELVSFAVDIDDFYVVVVLEVLTQFGNIYVHGAGIEVVIVNPNGFQGKVAL